MKKIQLVTVLFFGMFVFNMGTFYAKGPADTFAQNARQAILLDLSTGSVLYEKNADQKTAPSSMTKIVLAYMLFESIKLGQIKEDDTFRVSEKAWHTQGSRMFMPINSRVKVSDLLKGIVIQSGNDASVVVAEALGGTEENFAQEMTQKAQELGAKNTHFANVSGLDHPEHYSTVRDLAIISQKLIESFPEYYKVFGESEFTFSNIKQKNRNTLLSVSDLNCDGIKTGNTEGGGFGIVASAIKDGRRLLLVINGTPSEKARHVVAENLLNWGFRQFEKTLALKKLSCLETPKIKTGSQSTIDVGTLEDVYASTLKGAYKKFQFNVHYFEDVLEAPLKKGQEIGWIEIETLPVSSKTVRPLVCLETVEKAGFIRKVWLKIYHLIAG